MLSFLITLIVFTVLSAIGALFTALLLWPLGRLIVKDPKPGYAAAWTAMFWAHLVGFIVQLAIDESLTDDLAPAALTGVGAAFSVLILVFAIGYGFKTNAAKAIALSLLMSLVLWLFGFGVFDHAQDVIERNDTQQATDAID